MTSRSGDFEAFVRARGPGLLRLAYLLTGNPHRAEDLVQETLIRVHQAWRRVRIEYPEAYARRVLVHLNARWWRRDSRLSETLVAEPPDVHSQDADQLDLLLLRRALSELPRRQRAVVVLRYFEDLTEADCAEALGITVGTVKSQCHKALARLRELVPHLVDETELEVSGR